MAATDGTFYPSCVANLFLRFDEALHLSSAALPTPLSVGGYQPKSAGPRLTPLVTRTGKDNISFVVGRLPKQASVDLSGYRQAGKWKLTLDYRDLPVDPRICRAIAAEIHIGCVPASSFARGMTSLKSGGGRESILETRRDGAIREDTLVIYGLADTIHSEWTDNGAWVHLEGRDLRGVLLDAGARPALLAKLKLSRPIATSSSTGSDGVVNQILSLHPFDVGITVVVNPDDWPGKKVPSPADSAGLTRVNLGASGSSGAGPMPKGDPSQLSVWDIIVNYCNLVGAVPYFVGQRLFVRPARSLYDRVKLDANGDPAYPTPFAGGQPRLISTSAGEEQIQVRRLVFGRNVASLEFERKLGGVKVPQVEVVCLDTSSKNRGAGKLLIASWPEASSTTPDTQGALNEEGANALSPSGAGAQRALTNNVSPGGQTQRQVIRVPVSGIRDVGRLKAIARELWEEIGRGEMGGKVSTKVLTSLGGSSADPDLLALRPGDPVELLLDASSLRSTPPLASSVLDSRRRPFEEEVAEVMKRIPDENLARVLVATARNQVVELQSFFRVANVHFEWDVDSGVGVDFDFQNYLEARYDIDRQQRNTAKSVKSSTGGPAASTATSKDQGDQVRVVSGGAH